MKKQMPSKPLRTMLQSLSVIGALAIMSTAHAFTTLSPINDPFDNPYKPAVVVPEKNQPYVKMENVQRVFSTRVYFDSNVSSIAPDVYKTLDEILDIAEKNQIDAIYIIGHTDSDGSAASNRVLGKKRAESVASYLQGRDISKKVIHILTEGENNPKAMNINNDGKRINRRVDILVNYSHPKR